MSSGVVETIPFSANNLYQGGISVNGTSTFRSALNGTSTFSIQNSSSVSLFRIDTTNQTTNINRSTDGTLVNLQVAGVTQGTITVAAGAVSYNAFTGSHYGLFAEGSTTASSGHLIDLTGSNQYKQGSSEPIYGITKTTTANSPNVLGAYLATQDPANPASLDNPELISAAGNGEVWIADNGSGNVRIGDPLISSTIPGHAMRDPRTFPISHIFAKAAEPIDWDNVTTEVNGTKVAKITILYSFYDQDNSNAFLQGNIQSFSSDVLFNNHVSILGNLNVGGLATLQSLKVEGSVNVGGDLIVAGRATVRDITVNGRIITAGDSPTVNAGSEVNDAEVTVVGNSTSGTLTIMTGSTVGAGELATIIFAEPFTGKPRVVLTPANKQSANLAAYYDAEATTADQVSVFAGSAPQPNTTYSFTYFIVE
jgi:hypothetical protein